MNYKPYPETFWTKVETTIKSLKSNGSQPLVAAFDADGTLWDTDLGENFFQFQIDHQCVPLPTNPFNYYLELKKKNGDPREAYTWLAQINKDQNIADVRKWSQTAYDELTPFPLFSEQKKLIDLFLENQVQIYIVTASVSWAVEPGALALGIPADNVVGIQTMIKDNHVTLEPVLPITYRQGKADALLKKTNGIRPFFCCGNTTGDTELLAAATHLQLAVSAASRDDHLFQTENQLRLIAEKNNWLSHRFI